MQSSKIEVSQFSVQVAWGPRFWTLWASLLGAFWPPRWLKTLLEFLLDRPGAVQDYFFSAFKPSKSAPRGLQDRCRTAPGGQDAPRNLWGATWHPICLDFGANFAAKSSSRRPSECCSLVCGKASSSTAKQRFCKYALGRPLARSAT